MKNLTLSIKQLVLLCALLVTSVANAGLITTELTSDSIGFESDKERYFLGYDMGNEYDFIITATSSITPTDFGQYQWKIDTTDLLSLSFELVYLNANDFVTASASFGDEQLELASQSISFSQARFTNLSSNIQFLTFSLVANVAEGTSIGRLDLDKASLQIRNIQLTKSTSVPEPSTLVLFLLSIAFIIRRRLAK